MTSPCVLIAGGVDKGNDYSMLKPVVREKVRAIVCLGKDNGKIHDAFEEDTEIIVNTLSAREAVGVASTWLTKAIQYCCRLHVPASIFSKIMKTEAIN